jgi:hypothetical protein
MPKHISREKTAKDPTKRTDSTEAKFPFFNWRVSELEKWARETLAGKTGPFKRESPEWFAGGIIRYVEKIRFYLAESAKDRMTKEAYKGEAVDRATMEAYALGRFVPRMEDVVFRNREERNKNILLGVMARILRSKGGKTTGQRTKEAAIKRNVKVLSENERLLPKHPKERDRAAIIAKKLKRPYETIRSILKSSK